MNSWTDPDMLGRIADARGWMLDVDGCLVRTARGGGLGGEPIAGAIEFLNWLREHDKNVVICTNASQHPASEYQTHLSDLGLPVGEIEFITAATAAAHHIRRDHGHGPVVAVGDVGLFEALESKGVKRAVAGDTPAAVIVGSADTYATADINAACLAVADHDAPLYVTVDTPWFHGGRSRSVAISTAIAHAVAGITGKAPRVCGKPSAVLAGVLEDRLGSTGEDIVIVGDMASIEVRMAREMGALGVLVLSGGTAAADVSSLPAGDRPHLTADDVGALLAGLKTI